MGMLFSNFSYQQEPVASMTTQKEAYLKPSQTTKMELFAKIVNGFGR